MNMDNKNIDKLFKSGLNGHKAKAPAGAWDRLDSNLNGLKRKKTMIVFRWAAASVLILLAFGAGYFFATFNIPQSKITETENTPILQHDQSVISSDLKENKSAGDNMYPAESAENENQSAFAQIEEDKPEKISTKHSAVAANNLSETPDNNPASLSKKSNEPIQTERLVVPVLVMNEFDEIEIETDEIEVDTEIAAVDYEGKLENEGEAESDVKWEEYYTPPSDSRILKWTIGAQFAPTYSYREISTNYSAGAAGNDIENFNNTEESLLSYAGGVNVAYAFNSKWSFNSGMYFSRIGQVSSDALEFSESKGEYVLSGIYTSSGIIDFSIDNLPVSVRKVNPPKDSIAGIDQLNVKIIQNFDLFEVPFLVKYHLLNKKFSVNFSGGLSPAYVVRNKNYLEYESSRYDVGSTSNLNNFILNSTFGLGLGYQLSKKLAINFEPTFKYSLSPINSDSKVYYHPYYLSWFTGINYRF